MADKVITCPTCGGAFTLGENDVLIIPCIGSQDVEPIRDAFRRVNPHLPNDVCVVLIANSAHRGLRDGELAELVKRVWNETTVMRAVDMLRKRFVIHERP